MTPKELGQVLRDARKKSGMSQSELADALGVSQGTVSKFECGDMGIEFIFVAHTLCEKLKLKVNAAEKTIEAGE